MSHTSVYIIAEAGVNHNGQKDLALALIDAAAQAGADAVKFQTFKADKLASAELAMADYQQQNTGAEQSQRDMLRALELPVAWHAELADYTRERGLTFLSTAFDDESLGLLLSLNVPLLKVPSGELPNAPFVWNLAHTGKPLLISTGMASLQDVEQALAVVTHALNHAHEPRDMAEVWQSWEVSGFRMRLQGHVTLLHCTSQYPAPWAQVNLRAMDTLAQTFGLDVGYSDHTLGSMVAVAAVARGAQVIEKHLTLDKNMAGPDHLASLEPTEFAHMVRDIRALELALGDGIKRPQPVELATRAVVYQQVVAARDIAIGTVITRDDLTTARNGHGLAPTELWRLIGQPARRAYRAGEAVAE